MKHTIICVVALMTVVSNTASASWLKKKTDANANTTVAQAVSASAAGQAPDDRAVLTAVFNQASADLQELQTMMVSGNYVGALTNAKASLDAVRIKSGIDPKALFREKIPLPGNIFVGAFARNGQSFSDLPLNMQDAVALTVANYRGRYFLDILNLMKRTNLIYIRAMEQQLANSGGLMNRDIEKIKKDILDVFAIPLYLKEANSENYFLVFDFEVANSDQDYLFNRELLKYILSDGKVLGIPDESTLNQLITARQTEIRNEFKRSYAVAVPEALPAPEFISNKAAKTAGQMMMTSNFKTCMDYTWDRYNSTKAEFTDYCVEHFSFNWSDNVFKNCWDETWDKYNSTRVQFAEYCAKKTNK